MKYTPLWEAIKKDYGGSVTVHKDHAPTVIQAVKRTKSLENVARKQQRLKRYPRLVINVVPISLYIVRIDFTFYSDIRI